MIKSFSSKVRKFIASEGVSIDFEGNFSRVKVQLDVRKPLRSFVFSSVCREAQKNSSEV
jgi:hypothetical protein